MECQKGLARWFEYWSYRTIDMLIWIVNRALQFNILCPRVAEAEYLKKKGFLKRYKCKNKISKIKILKFF